ncbi:MAG: hypothetical protein LBU14_01115 [Candidatus Peribacteria bacterium]|nr:hypothetical protein [Candidatus Peribacteria bacterium]
MRKIISHNNSQDESQEVSSSVVIQEFVSVISKFQAWEFVSHISQFQKSCNKSVFSIKFT